MMTPQRMNDFCWTRTKYDDDDDIDDDDDDDNNDNEEPIK